MEILKDKNLIHPQTNPLDIFDSLDVSASTIKNYKERAEVFLYYAREVGINRDSYLDFKKSLSARSDLSVSTKNNYLVSAKVFLKEANRKGLLPSDITQNIKLFSQNKKHKRDGLNDEEIKKLTEATKLLPKTAQNARLKAILSLLVFQGLRQIEVVRLDVKDLDLVAETAFIQGKGQDDKEPINLHPETTKALQEYLKSNKIADGALFISQSNNSRDKRITTRSIRDIVKEILNSLGIKKTTHGFRHYFTSTLIKNYKGDLLEVAQYTRHKSLEMLQVYNDNIKKKADLPRFYQSFNGVNL